jgi:hypothetical protein
LDRFRSSEDKEEYILMAWCHSRKGVRNFKMKDILYWTPYIPTETFAAQPEHCVENLLATLVQYHGIPCVLGCLGKVLEGVEGSGTACTVGRILRELSDLEG